MLDFGGIRSPRQLFGGKVSLANSFLWNLFGSNDSSSFEDSALPHVAHSVLHTECSYRKRALPNL